MHRTSAAVLILAACSSAPAPSALPWGARSDRNVPLGIAGASVVVDEGGAAHVYAATDADLAKAQGWLHARERLFQMMMFRAVAKGRLTSIFGKLLPTIHEADVSFRLWSITPRGRHVEDEIAERLPADLRALLQAYADGVNAHVARVKAGEEPLPPELETLAYPAEAIETWTVTDTLAVGRLQSRQLSAGDEQELERTEWLAALSADVGSDLLTPFPLTDAVILPGFLSDRSPWQHTRALRRGHDLSRMDEGHRARLAAAGPQLRAALERIAALPALLVPHGMRAGSNNWTVSGSLTDNGHAMLCNDPHLGLSFPPNFHFASLDSISAGTGTLRIAGAAFPGIPGVILGHSDHVAWGATVAGYDVTDLYLEQVTAGTGGAPDTVLFRGAQVPVVKLTESFSAGPGKGEETDTVELVPHHGPIMPGSRTATSAVSLKWTGMEPTRELEAIAGLWRAKNVDEAMAALSGFGVGAQNWVLADTSGHIAYDPHACIPNRKGDLETTPPWLVMPGDGSGAEWDGCIADDRLAWARDPTRGWIATANNDIAGKTADGDPLAHGDYWYGWPEDFGMRGKRIGDLVAKKSEGGRKLSADDLRDIQHDVHATMADVLLPYLFAAEQQRPDLAEKTGTADALARLHAWSRGAVTGFAGATFESGPADEAARRDAIATSIFNEWWPIAFQALVQPTLQGKAGTRPGDQQVVKMAVAVLQASMQVQLPAGTVSIPLRSPQWKAGVPDAAATLLGALEQAVANLPTIRGFTSDPASWLWGRMHPVTLGGFLGNLGISVFDEGPYPCPGMNWTVNVAGFSAPSSYAATHGANIRVLYDVSADGIRTTLTWPGGESGLHGDPNSRNELVDYWLLGREHPFWHVAADVGAHVREVVTLR